MAYTLPPKNIPFRFTSSGYSAPASNNVSFRFNVPTADLQSMINVMQTYQTETYSYVKYSPTYVVGYTAHGVQIIKGPYTYGGIRDLGGSLTIIAATGYVDLPSYIKAFNPGQYDLGAGIGMHLPVDLTASLSGYGSTFVNVPGIIHGWQLSSLQAAIGAHQPSDLLAYLNVVSRSSYDLPANIYGWGAYNLQAYLNTMFSKNLRAILVPVVGVDLTAYLKAWPQMDLTANTYGWQTYDLSAQLNLMWSRNLLAYIGAHLAGNLMASLKGWGREEEGDLSALIGCFDFNDLSSQIRAKYFNNLSGYLNTIQPISLPASIYGWQASNLQGTLNVRDYPYNLTASIVASGGLKNLSAYLRSVTYEHGLGNLYASLHSWQTSNLSAVLTAIRAGILSAYINVVGGSSDLSASLYPRMIRLTSILSISTMEHLDLSAMINNICSSSGFKNLACYLYTIYKGDLSAYINAYRPSVVYRGITASVGYLKNITYVDKLPLSINIYRSNYRNEDKLPISLSVFQGFKSLSAAVAGEYRNYDLLASIEGSYLDPYNFEGALNRKIVYKLSHVNLVEYFRIVELSFRSVVDDYFYFSSGGVAYKTDRFDRWVLDVKSYIPENITLGTKRRLHRTVVIGDLSRFSTLDEAIKYAIAFVTDDLYGDLSATIVPRGVYNNLSGLINCVYTRSTSTDLNCYINPVGNRVVASFDGGIGVF